MKGIVLAIALLPIYGVHAQDAKGPSEVKQDGPLQERPDTTPADTMREPGTTDTGRESDDNTTRPRTTDDVVRDILRDRPSGDKSSGPASPTPESRRH
jgi:hypothetical protein